MRFTVNSEIDGPIEATTLHEEGPFEYGDAIEVTTGDQVRVLYPVDMEEEFNPDLNANNDLYDLYAQTFELLNELDQLSERYSASLRTIAECDTCQVGKPKTGKVHARVRTTRKNPIENNA